MQNLVEVTTLLKSKPYLESLASLDGQRQPAQCTNVFMGDLDHNQFQQNFLHNIANDTVALLGVENVAYHEKRATCIE